MLQRRRAKWQLLTPNKLIADASAASMIVYQVMFFLI
jgi:hypothetical protein